MGCLGDRGCGVMSPDETDGFPPDEGSSALAAALNGPGPGEVVVSRADLMRLAVLAVPIEQEDGEFIGHMMALAKKDKR